MQTLQMAKSSKCFVRMSVTTYILPSSHPPINKTIYNTCNRTLFEASFIWLNRNELLHSTLATSAWCVAVDEMRINFVTQITINRWNGWRMTMACNGNEWNIFRRTIFMALRIRPSCTKNEHCATKLYRGLWHSQNKVACVFVCCCYNERIKFL